MFELCNDDSIPVPTYPAILFENQSSSSIATKRVVHKKQIFFGKIAMIMIIGTPILARLEEPGELSIHS